jgi:COP9 signalosome complex subunit 2
MKALQYTRIGSPPEVVEIEKPTAGPGQVLLKVIKPYTRISIGFIAREINISPAEVEQLLVTLILDGMIDGSMDQLSQQLHLNQSSTDKAKYQAAEKWATQLQTLQQAVIGKLA